MIKQMGKLLVITGIIILVIGLLMWLGGDKLSWFGNLPGDIKIVRENFRFYFPITTMILLSVVLTVILWLVRKIF